MGTGYFFDLKSCLSLFSCPNNQKGCSDFFIFRKMGTGSKGACPYFPNRKQIKNKLKTNRKYDTGNYFYDLIRLVVGE